MGPDGYYQLLLDQAEKARGKVVAIGECGLGRCAASPACGY